MMTNFRSDPSRPRFRTLYGRKAALGVVAGLGIIVGDVLFYSIVIPATTTSEVSTTIVLFILGVAVAAFSNLSGLIRVAGGKKSQNQNPRER